MAPEVILFLLMNLVLHLNVVCVFRECISVVFDPSQNIIMETLSFCETKVQVSICRLKTPFTLYVYQLQCIIVVQFIFQVVNRRGHTQAADWWSYGVLMVSKIVLSFPLGVYHMNALL